MKFNFQFESILNVRQHQEKKEQQKLARLLGKDRQLQKEVHADQEKLHSFEQLKPDGQRQTAAEVRHRYELKQDLQREIWQKQQEHRKLQQQIEQQRSELIEINKKTQMLEKLKDRERIKFIEHYQQLEQKQQNAIATQIYNREKQHG